MSKFTPGPWYTNFEQKDVCFVNSANREICSLPIEDSESKDLAYDFIQLAYIGEIQTNATLIAIAPAMYKFLSNFSKLSNVGDHAEMLGWQHEANEIIKGI